MKTLARFLSRKLLVFCVGTVALFAGNLPPEHWVVLASAYMGIQGMLDWKHPKENDGSSTGEG